MRAVFGWAVGVFVPREEREDFKDVGRYSARNAIIHDQILGLWQPHQKPPSSKSSRPLCETIWHDVKLDSMRQITAMKAA